MSTSERYHDQICEQAYVDAQGEQSPEEIEWQGYEQWLEDHYSMEEQAADLDKWEAELQARGEVTI